MSYDLYANNKALPSFHAVGWTHLLDQCGAYFPYVTQGARWYALFGAGSRMSMHKHGDDENKIEELYPAIICNCGFKITKEETKVMARIARNYAAIQRSLDSSHEINDSHYTLPEYQRPFPQKVRSDWVDSYEDFADWAEKSQGFEVH